MKKIISILVIGCLLATTIVSVNACNVAYKQTQKNTSGAFDGYILFSPLQGLGTYLVNNNKIIVHSWHTIHLGCDAHLLENRNLLRTCFISNRVFPIGGRSGAVEMYNWNGICLWNFTLSDSHSCIHHDIEPLPNGNVLMIVWENKTRNEAIAAGRNPIFVDDEGLWPDYIIEVKPTYPEGGTIVWEWHAWDHLIQDFDSTKNNYGVVADHPELIDINFDNPTGPFVCADWMHSNSIDYNPHFDQILISSRNLNEIFIIDHSTTTEEARGHTDGNSGKGGDILYRWGNPQNYRAGDSNDQKCKANHDARWVEPGCPGAGHITFYNAFKGLDSIDEIVPPVDANGHYTLNPGEAYGPNEPIWSYSVDGAGWSGCQRIPNGNTVAAVDATLIVVTPDKNLVWQYNQISPPLDAIWKLEYYNSDYPGVKSLSLNLENDQAVKVDNLQPLRLLLRLQLVKTVVLCNIVTTPTNTPATTTTTATLAAPFSSQPSTNQQSVPAATTLISTPTATTITTATSTAPTSKSSLTARR